MVHNASGRQSVAHAAVVTAFIYRGRSLLNFFLLITKIAPFPLVLPLHLSSHWVPMVDWGGIRSQHLANRSAVGLFCHMSYLR